MRKLALAGVVAVVWVSTAHAVILCQKKTGVIVAREACKKKEAQLSLSGLGVGPSGPPGPAGPAGASGPTGATGPAGAAGASGTAWAWAYVLANGNGFLAFSGDVELSVVKPQTGVYCILTPTHYGYKGAQATVADPGETKYVSVGIRSTVCDTYSNDATNVVPVFLKNQAGVAVDGDFTIVIP